VTLLVYYILKGRNLQAQRIVVVSAQNNPMLFAWDHPDCDNRQVR